MGTPCSAITWVEETLTTAGETFSARSAKLSGAAYPGAAMARPRMVAAVTPPMTRVRPDPMTDDREFILRPPMVGCGAADLENKMGVPRNMPVSQKADLGNG